LACVEKITSIPVIISKKSRPEACWQFARMSRGVGLLETEWERTVVLVVVSSRAMPVL